MTGPLEEWSAGILPRQQQQQQQKNRFSPIFYPTQQNSSHSQALSRRRVIAAFPSSELRTGSRAGGRRRPRSSSPSRTTTWRRATWCSSAARGGCGWWTGTSRASSARPTLSTRPCTTSYRRPSGPGSRAPAMEVVCVDRDRLLLRAAADGDAERGAPQDASLSGLPPLQHQGRRIAVCQAGG